MRTQGKALNAGVKQRGILLEDCNVENIFRRIVWGYNMFYSVKEAILLFRGKLRGLLSIGSPGSQNPH